MEKKWRSIVELCPIVPAPKRKNAIFHCGRMEIYGAIQIGLRLVYWFSDQIKNYMKYQTATGRNLMRKREKLIHC
jgi:hypothetical protein